MSQELSVRLKSRPTSIFSRPAIRPRSASSFSLIARAFSAAGRPWASGFSRQTTMCLITAARRLLARRRAELLDEDVVDEALLLGLDRAHEVVALRVGLDALDRLTRVLDQQLVQLVARPEDLLGVDVDVGRL